MILYIIAIATALIAVLTTAFYAKEINLLSENMQQVITRTEQTKKQTIANKAQIKHNADDVNTCLIAIRGDITKANKEIDAIIAKLQTIVEDIHRIDHDEHEIRSYYVNFREPKFDNSGVEWAEEYVTNDD